MATFPTLTPSSRSFTPGRHPHSEIRTLNGLQSRVRTSNVLLEQRLRLTFVALTETQMLGIRSHYNGQQGRFLSFAIPDSLLSGMAVPASFTPTGYTWIYATTPQVEDIGLQRYTVSVELVTVPPEGANINGAELFAASSFVPGGISVSADNVGLNLTVTITVAGGIAQDNTSAGLSITSTVTFVAGTADGGVAANDPNWANVRLLLSGNSLPTTDESSFATPITTGTTLPGIDTSIKQFGEASLSFPGDINRDCRVASTNNNVDVPSNTPFTWECWIYLIRVDPAGRTNINAFMESQGGADYIFGVSRPSAGQPPRAFFIPANSTAGYYHQSDMFFDTWTHLALVREPTTHRIYLYTNGIKSTTFEASSAGLDNSVFFTVGKRQSGTSYNFRLDEVRITVGTARYTADFTPPTAAFPRG